MSVDYELNLGGNYVQTMGQAVAATSQYADVAQGVYGKVGNLSNAMVGLTNRVTGLNRINSVATDTAAGYQKQLANIEATTAVTGKSFDALSKSTRQLARDFPIGMQGAVDVVESLQSVGVKSESAIGKLGKSFVNLGAATNTNAASIGRDMTLLGKSFGNGTAQFDALSDSLTTVTKQLGASAPSVIAFSKAIAPIATTVGMGQSSVMGLSAAMSSLGEDGYRAANTFNKVLLDMNKAVRDGGPGLKAYADVMGTTSDKLGKLFKSNPSEMLAQFTEALGKSGPDAQRALEALGFDSVRDTRSLQALSRSGGLRSAIDTSVNAYGSGSTEKASEAAMGGVVDQAEKLKETMGQTVQNLGAPVLGILKNQMSVATGVAELMQKVTGSDPVQKSGVPLAVAGTVGGAAMNALSIALYGAMAKTGWQALSRSSIGQGFRAGAAAGSAAFPSAPTQAGALRGGAAQAGWMATSLMRNTGMGSFGEATGRVGEIGRAGVSMSAAMGTRMVNAWYGNLFRGANGMTAIQTEEGQRAKYAIGEATRTAAGQRLAGGAEGPMMTRTMAAERAAMANRDMLAAAREQGMVRTSAGLVGASGAVAAQGGLFAAGTLVKGAAAAGGALKSLLPFSPAMLGVAGAVGGGMWAYGQHNEANDRRQRIQDSTQDIYSAFNNFAEAAGQAGRGLVSFDSAVKQSTENLSKQSTSIDKALTLSSTEIGQARNAGYQMAFKPIGDSVSSKDLAGQVKMVLGPDAAPQDIKRMVMDIVSKYGTDVGQRTMAELDKFYSPGGGKGAIDYTQMLSSLAGQNGPVAGLMGPTEAQTELTAQNLGQMSQRQSEANSTFAGTRKVGDQTITAGTVIAREQAKALYEAAQAQFAGMDVSNLNRGDWQPINEMLQKLMGVQPEQAGKAGISNDFMAAGADMPYVTGGNKPMTFAEWEKQAALANAGNAKAWQAVGQKGWTSSDLSDFSGQNEASRAARVFSESLATATGSGKALANALFDLDAVAGRAGKSIQNFPQEVIDGLTPNQKTMQAAIAQPEDAKKTIAAGQVLWAEALKDSNGNTTKALSALAMNEANLPESEIGKRNAAASAIQLGNAAQQVDYAGRTRGSVLAEQIQVGRQAEQAPTNTSTSISAQTTIQTGQAAQGGMAAQGLAFVQQTQAMALQIQGIQRSAGVSMGAIARDGALKVQYATEDFHLSQKRAKQDHHIQVNQMEFDYQRSRKRATKEFQRSERYADEDYNLQRTNTIRDFNISMGRAKRDFDKSIERATRDYDTGTERADRDFKKQQLRAEEDYQKQRLRATDDYNKSIFRANRDFGIQQVQATEDFNKQRTRSVEDYNKTVKRMVEDSAKQMYDPYKRISAQMVMDAGQLVANLRDQTKTLEQQTANLATARGMGMTDDTIKALSLSDAANAQQLQRLIEDGGKNPDLIRQLNAQAAAKAGAAGGLVSDKGNTSFSRTEEDFATSQARATEDFTIGQTRATEAFARSMSDAATDFNTSMVRMSDDYTISTARAKDDFTTSMADRALDFKKQIADMTFDYLKGLKDARDDLDKGLSDMAIAYGTARIRAGEQFQQSLDWMEQDHELSLQRLENQFDRTTRRAVADFEKSIRRMKVATANAISDVGAQVGAQIQNMKDQLLGLGESFDPANQLENAKGVLATFMAMAKERGITMTELYNQMSADNKHLYDWADGVVNATDKAKKAKMTYYGYVPMSQPKVQDSWIDKWESITGIDIKSKLGVFEDNYRAFYDSMQAKYGKGPWAFLVKSMPKPEDVSGAVDSALTPALSSLDGKRTIVNAAMTPAWRRLYEALPESSKVKTELGKALDPAIDTLPEREASVKNPMIKNWAHLAANMPLSETVKANLVTALGLADTYLTTKNVDTKRWITSAWGEIAEGSNFPSPMDVLKQLLPSFGTPTSGVIGFLQGLSGKGTDSVNAWVGDGWEHVAVSGQNGNTPSPGQVKDEVVLSFGDASAGTGIAGWLSSLGSNGKKDGLVATWVGGSWADIFKNLPEKNGEDGFGPKFEGLFGSIADYIWRVAGASAGSWGGMKLKIPVPDILMKVVNMLPDSQFTTNLKEFAANGITLSGLGQMTSPKPNVQMAQGGIATSQQTALIAESSYPEAVIPLNDRGVSYLVRAFSTYLGSTMSSGNMASANENGLMASWTEEYKQERLLKAAVDRLVHTFDPLSRDLPSAMVTAGAAAIGGLTQGLTSVATMAQVNTSAVTVSTNWVDALLKELIESEKKIADGVTTMLGDIVANADFVTSLNTAGAAMTGLISDGMVKDLSSEGATYKEVMAAAVALAQAAAAAAGAGSYASSYSGSGGGGGSSSPASVGVPQQVGSSPTAMTKPVQPGTKGSPAAAATNLMHWDPIKHMLVPGAIGGGPMEAYKARWVGEGGPELFLSSVNGQMIPAGVANRLLSNMEAKQTMVSPYSSPTTINITHTQDYSTKVTGPITVMSQDPNDMMDQLAAKARRSRLGNPVAGRND